MGLAGGAIAMSRPKSRRPCGGCAASTPPAPAWRWPVSSRDRCRSTACRPQQLGPRDAWLAPCVRQHPDLGVEHGSTGLDALGFGDQVFHVGVLGPGVPGVVRAGPVLRCGPDFRVEDLFLDLLMHAEYRADLCDQRALLGQRAASSVLFEHLAHGLVVGAQQGHGVLRCGSGLLGRRRSVDGHGGALKGVGRAVRQRTGSRAIESVLGANGSRARLDAIRPARRACPRADRTVRRRALLPPPGSA
jgi:hypothetical protein